MDVEKRRDLRVVLIENSIRVPKEKLREKAYEGVRRDFLESLAV